MYKVVYANGGKWDVLDQNGNTVGQLRQSFDQSWTARTHDGQLRLINTEREYGGNKTPFEIANELVIW
ncbi:hypothetical protein FDH62_gp32 [Arthrobacter phage Pumancara]|uniref:Uncharacterized protein n=1 Tax=Arthrobacter phage Pumancara TaxID=1772311 RepID=A0A0U4IGZ8_9CAUD|nr:hypothetical protein FDH62_gp32 [Arthrobacter phage Pumancara]ALY09990.1 hypothetical protein PUMANCARA_32 [Arthrobacter phage Pumancara]